MRQHTTIRDSGSDQGIEFFVASNGELEMTGGDTLDLEVLGRVASQFQHFSSQILKHGRYVDRSLCAYAHLVLGVLFEEPLDTTTWELETRARRVTLLLLGCCCFGARLASGALSAR